MKNSDDNYLHCPTVQDIMYENIQHFYKQWIRGESVIVHNVWMIHKKKVGFIDVLRIYFGYKTLGLEVCK